MPGCTVHAPTPLVAQSFVRLAHLSLRAARGEPLRFALAAMADLARPISRRASPYGDFPTPHVHNCFLAYHTTHACLIRACGRLFSRVRARSVKAYFCTLFKCVCCVACITYHSYALKAPLCTPYYRSMHISTKFWAAGMLNQRGIHYQHPVNQKHPICDLPCALSWSPTASKTGHNATAVSLHERSSSSSSRSRSN
jgi:hypothetical protein